MTDITPVDFISDVGMVRALIPDYELLPNPMDPTEAPSYIFTDEVIEVYIALATGNHIKRAAATACGVLASSENLILKKLTENDLATDGPAVSKEFRLRAADLRKEADDEDTADDVGADMIISAPYIPYPASMPAEDIIRQGRW